MRVLHIIPSLSPACGGPSFALPSMARALSSAGVLVDVVTTNDDGPGRRNQFDVSGVPAQFDGFRVFYFQKQTEFYKVSLPLFGWLLRNVQNYDLVHVHAVFSFSSMAAAWACSLKGVPYIIRPLGVLGWGMHHRRRRLKALSFRLLDKPVLDRAAAIHYTSRQEQDDAAQLGLCARPVVIPLGFDLSAFQTLPPVDVFLSRFPQAVDKKICLYLSRLDPKKNVESLLEAFAALHAGNVLLVIAGGGEKAHVEHLQKRSVELGIAHNVLWAGHLDGELKLSAMAAASLYVLPSLAENFGIALLEAMAAARACVSTPRVALAAEAAKEDAVLLSEVDSDSLASSIKMILEDSAKATSLALNAASLVRKKYSADSMAAALIQLYKACIDSHSSRS